MQDLGIVRGLITLLTFAVFVGICWWAYRPSSRRRFEEDALLPFDETDGVPGPPLRVDDAKRGESA